MINAFSIDLEYWWHNEFLKGYEFKKEDPQLGESTEKLLNLLEKYNVNSTFFVLGCVAQKEPELIEKINDAGHEIASHGYSHKPVNKLERSEFEDEIKKSIDILYKITHEKPLGFRAPSFSINNENRWAFEVLEKYKFRYDASIFPIKTMLYGLPEAPLNIYRPSKEDLAVNDPNGKLLEFPSTVLRLLGKNFPFSGGFYLRTIPAWILKAGLRQINKDRPFVIYTHPREINPNIPKLHLPFKSKFIVYHGVNSTLGKIEMLLKNFKFTSIREVLENDYGTFNE
ncbi:MAG: polysaccharide deacetylase family protein [Methanobacterium sp.]|uniref:polysaccharide deacetylase family protein n=1 Tax=Methanobacterium sp. TaxID=2164 RepID=UPI003D6527E0|nr:polysaccharide deacetylase family protein [Methanobacterium sp.]